MVSSKRDAQRVPGANAWQTRKMSDIPAKATNHRFRYSLKPDPTTSRANPAPLRVFRSSNPTAVPVMPHSASFPCLVPDCGREFKVASALKRHDTGTHKRKMKSCRRDDSGLLIDTM